MFRLHVLAIFVTLLGLELGHAHAQQAPTAPVSPVVAPAAAQSYTLSAYPSRARAAQQGYRRHDGFFLRMSAGGGVGATTYKERASDGAASRTRTLGGAALTEIAVGWAVMENLILHSTLSLAHQSSLKKYGSEPYSDDEASTLLGFFGGGITYYFMPINVYVSGSIGAGGLSQTSGHRHEDFESEIGLGTSIAIGKEWWIGRSGDWALGGAITGSYYQAPFEVDNVKSTYRGHNTGFAFTATYN